MSLEQFESKNLANQSVRSWRDRLLFFKHFNPVIRWLILSDVVLFGSMGLLAPIISLFIADYLPGGNIQTAGIAASIYLFTKSLAQIPIAAFLDRKRGQKDEFNFLLAGSIGFAVVSFLYIFVSSVPQFYFLEFLSGLAGAAAVPSYMSIFTMHIDRERSNLEWGAYYTSLDLANAAAGAIGGTIAFFIGFQWLFIIVSILSLIGASFLLVVRKQIIAPEVKSPAQA